MSGFLTTEQIWKGLPSVAPDGELPKLASQHRSPRCGYGTDTKKQWRDSLWESLVRHLPKFAYVHDAGVGAGLGTVDPPRSWAKAFVVDTTEGFEIEKALKLGFAEKHIHVCNVNPAIVATLKRRFPSIVTYGVAAEVALRRAHSEGIRFEVISLDLCGPLSLRTLDTLDAARAVVNGVGSVGLTLMRGREPSNIRMDIPGSGAFYRKLARHAFRRRAEAREDCLRTDKDFVRVLGPWFRLMVADVWWGDKVEWKGEHEVCTSTPEDEWCRVSLMAGGVYSSGAVTMMWLCFALVQPTKWFPTGRLRGPASGWRIKQARWSRDAQTRDSSVRSCMAPLRL